MNRTYKKQNEEIATETIPKAPAPKTADISWNKFDFVAGDEVIFEDNLVDETIGEFPSQWDLLGGQCRNIKDRQ